MNRRLPSAAPIGRASPILLLLAACQPAAEAPLASASNVNGTSTPVDASKPVAAAELPGEYRVGGVDAGGIDLPHAITASIGQTRIDLRSGCIRYAFGYRLDGGRIMTEALPAPSCRRALYPEERALEAAFLAARTVRRSPAYGIVFEGEGRSVTLFSQ